MFDNLSDRLRKTLANLTGRGRVSEADVDAAAREIRLALLEADVNFKVVKDVVGRIREQAVGAEILAQPHRGPAGREDRPRRARRAPRRPAIGRSGSRATPPSSRSSGLQGSGKTTTAAKLARHIVKLGPPAAPRRRGSVPARRRRPARRRSARRIDIPVHRAPAGTSTVDIARGSLETARRLTRDTIILDTAGPAEPRRGAHGRDRRRRQGGPPGRDAPRRRRDDRPGGGRRRAGVRRGRARHRASSSPRSTATPAAAPRSRSRPSPGSASSSWAPARRPTRSRSSIPTGSPAGSSAWATS